MLKKHKIIIIFTVLVALVVLGGWQLIPNETNLSDSHKPFISSTKYSNEFSNNFLNEKNHYDVIVAGGEPEGIAAAVSAARNGARVLLVCENKSLGGLFTLCQLNVLDLSTYKSSVDNEDILVNQGFFQEFYNDLGDSFNIEQAKQWFFNLVRCEPNIKLMMDTEIISPIIEGNTIKGLVLSQNNQEENFYGKRIIDATLDADIAAMSNVPYSIGMEDFGRPNKFQAATLVFELSGVNPEGIRNYVRSYHEKGDFSVGIDNNSAWGYGKEALKYQSRDKNIRLRGANIGFKSNGNVLINALLVCGVNGLDEESCKEGIRRAKEELPYVIKFMQENFRGFENCKLVNTAERLYIRETRHIYGEYRLTIDDVAENRNFKDKIALGSYPVDIQPAEAGENVKINCKPVLYSIPYGCTVPQKIDNLWVVGRCASYDSIPHGSARTVPIGMSVAEAVGVAATYSIDNQLSPREICYDKQAIKSIQKTLIEQGAYLPDFHIPKQEIEKHWAYSGIKALRSLNLITAGYSNNYHLDNNPILDKETIINRIKTICIATNKDFSYFEKEFNNKNIFFNNDIFNYCYYLIYNKPAKNLNDAISTLEDISIIEKDFYKNASNISGQVRNIEFSYLLGKTYNYIKLR